MCNLYKTRSSAAEVAGHFRAQEVLPFNVAEEIYPGYPGMVVRDDNGRRTLEAMTWGFPRPMKSKRTGLPIKPKPVNNAREDKLETPFWRSSFEQRRCLIPATAWAEAEGEQRKMTRTWYSPAGFDLFAIGGIWRWSEEWGNVYSMVMVDGCQQMAEVHDRMPVLLRPDQWELWTRGPPEEAFSLCVTCNDELTVERTVELWAKPRASLSQQLL
jgi:putative SOS response-associated peptidase YedK